MAMLFAPFGCTHPFVHTQNLYNKKQKKKTLHEVDENFMPGYQRWYTTLPAMHIH